MNINSKKNFYNRTIVLTTVDALVIIVILIYTYTFLVTEILSFLHALNKISIISAWVTFLLMIFCGKFFFTVKFKIETHDKIEWLFRLIVIIIGSYIGFMAFNTIPYNYDSMTYHLPRVMHWIQNESVEFYATNIDRQIFISPLAEYMILHIELLFGKETLYNLVQFSAYIVSAIVIYGICSKINLSVSIRYLVIILYMTMPITIAEATTTQNDLLACMWTLCGVYIVLDYLQAPALNLSGKHIGKTMLLAIVCAMCYLTKGTACIALIPFVIGMGIVRIIKKDSITTLIVHVFLAIVFISIIISPFIFKNYQLYGSILGLNNYDNVLVDTLEVKYLIVNIIKNIATHLKCNEYTWMNEGISTFVLGVANLMNIDVNDAMITWSGTVFSIVPSYNCDLASCPIILALALLLLLILPFIYKEISRVQFFFFAMSYCAFILLFSLIKWQPWITRLTIGVTGVLCISVGISLNALCIQLTRFRQGLITAVMTLSLFSAIYPLDNLHIVQKATREYGNFYANIVIEDKYLKAIDLIKEKGYQAIGIKSGVNSYEYPLWNQLLENGVTIEHIMVENEVLSQLEDKSYIPDCILIIDVSGYNEDTVLLRGQDSYYCIANYDGLLIYEKEEPTYFKVNRDEIYTPDDIESFGRGFSSSEGDHIWMVNEESKILVDYQNFDSEDVLVSINYYTINNEQQLNISVEGTVIYEDTLTSSNTTSTLSFTIPAELIPDGKAEIYFYHPDAIAPKDMYVSKDRRKLSISILDFKFGNPY